MGVCKEAARAKAVVVERPCVCCHTCPQKRRARASVHGKVKAQAQVAAAERMPTRSSLCAMRPRYMCASARVHLMLAQHAGRGTAAHSRRTRSHAHASSAPLSSARAWSSPIGRRTRQARWECPWYWRACPTAGPKSLGGSEGSLAPSYRRVSRGHLSSHAVTCATRVRTVRTQQRQPY